MSVMAIAAKPPPPGVPVARTNNDRVRDYEAALEAALPYPVTVVPAAPAR
jgi:hypothetical protein